MNKVFVFFVFFLFTLSAEAETYKPRYKPLGGIEMASYSKGVDSFSYDGKKFNLHYSLYSQRGEYSSEFMKENISIATEFIFKFADTKGLSARECRPTTNLEFYDIDESILNDDAIFSDWKKNQKASYIWGLYDPVITDPNGAAIFLTEHGEFYNRLLVGHELSHYWFDRFCWERGWSNSAESFAQEFEVFYSSSYLNKESR
jgi:hypothetical protein